MTASKINIMIAGSFRVYLVSKRWVLTQLLTRHVEGSLDYVHSGKSRTRKGHAKQNGILCNASPAVHQRNIHLLSHLLFVITFAFDRCEQILSFITCSPLSSSPSLVCIQSLSPVAVKSYYRSISGRLVFFFF